MLKIGLTGGIGSGKTTVANIFEHLGYPVYLSDKEAHRLTNSHTVIIKKITELFGHEIYLSDQTLNKKALADIIFKDNKKLEQINRIVHPRVMEDFIEWAQKQNDCPAVIFESAILFEAGFEKYFNYIICVYADETTRIKRVCARDNISEIQVRKRIKNQMNNDEKCRMADFIINTDGNCELTEQIHKIIHAIKQAGHFQ